MWINRLLSFIGYTLFILHVSLSESIRCSKNCTLEIIGEDLPHRPILTIISDQECEDMVFHRTHGSQLSEFCMEASPYKGLYRNFSTIHSTFSKIKWHYLKIRIKPRKPGGQPFCQEMRLPHGFEFPDETKVELECRRYCDDNEILDVDYTISRHHKEESRNYALKIPRLKGISNDTIYGKWQLFTYVDTTEIPKLTVYWTAAPENFEVESYLVDMINAEKEEILRSVRVYVVHNKDIFSQEFVELLSGKFYFTVQPESASKILGYISKSPEVWVGQPSELPIFVIIIIAGAVVLISVLLYVFLLKACCMSGKPRTVLMVYERTRQTHLDAVLALAKYLRETCNVDAKIDEVDIRLSDNMNPFDWCQEVFSRADAVMVLSSPPQVLNHEVGIYRRLGGVGLNLLAEHFYEYNKRQDFFCALLPYCSVEDIPTEARNLRCFSLPNDLEEMVWYIHQGSRFPRLSRLYFMSKYLRCNRQSIHRSERLMLLNTFDQATKNVQEPLIPTVIVSNIPELPPLESLDAQPGDLPSEGNEDDDLNPIYLLDSIMNEGNDISVQISEDDSETRMNTTTEEDELLSEHTGPHNVDHLRLSELVL